MPGAGDSAEICTYVVLGAGDSKTLDARAAEAIAMIRRLLAGIEARGDSLALELFAALGHSGEFLGARHTKQWFKVEQHLPSAVIDRASVRAWAEGGRADAAARARARVAELLGQYQRPALASEAEAELIRLTEQAARHAGLDRLPELPQA